MSTPAPGRSWERPHEASSVQLRSRHRPSRRNPGGGEAELEELETVAKWVMGVDTLEAGTVSVRADVLASVAHSVHQVVRDRDGDALGTWGAGRQSDV